MSQNQVEPAGYIVAGRDFPDGPLRENWDGEVHPTLEAGRQSLKECHEAGWPDWKLYALQPVD